MLVFVFPGQGSQSPGFLAPWLELPGVADRLRWASAVVGDDLLAHGTVSDAQTLRDTAVAQPLIVAAGLLGLRELVASPAELAGVAGAVAGHSVGELTAAAASGSTASANGCRLETAVAFSQLAGKRGASG